MHEMSRDNPPIARYDQGRKLCGPRTILPWFDAALRAGIPLSEGGPPPMKWSDSKYGFATEEDCNGEEAQA